MYGWWLLGLVSLGLFATPVAAQWAVIDAAQVENSAKQILNEARMIENQYRQITNEITMITNQVKNLQRLPHSIIGDMQRLGGQVTGLLRVGQGLGFDLTTSMQQWNTLYPAITSAGTSPQTLAMRLRWLQARRQITGTSVQVTSIAQDLVQRFAQLCDLLNKSMGVSGNLDAHQVTHQQLALAQAIAMQSQQLQAVRDRMAAQELAEATVMEELRLRHLEDAMQPIDTNRPYEADGKMHDYAQWDN